MGNAEVPDTSAAFAPHEVKQIDGLRFDADIRTIVLKPQPPSTFLSHPKASIGCPTREALASLSHGIGVGINRSIRGVGEDFLLQDSLDHGANASSNLKDPQRTGWGRQRQRLDQALPDMPVQSSVVYALFSG
jgi:hypothetical protein